MLSPYSSFAKHRVFSRYGSKDEIEIKLDEYAKFERGWSFGRGESFTASVLQRAEALYSDIKNYGFPVEIFPGEAGDILFSLSTGDRFLNIGVMTDGSLELTLERGIGEKYSEEYVGPVPLQTIKEKFAWLRPPSQTISSESSTSNATIAQSSNDSWGPLSKKVVRVAASLFSTTNAGHNSMRMSVPT